jgi:glycosyltransferase involved in cell wall biosynthesis
MTPALVSIVIPTRNRSAQVGKAIESALVQDYPAFEVWVIDDCSTDDTARVVEEFAEKDSRCHYFRMSPQAGLAAARNTGFEKATGLWVALLDDDDRLTADSISRRMRLVENQDDLDRLGVVYGAAELILADQNRKVLLLPKILGDIKEYLLSRRLKTISSSHLMPRKVWQAIGGFDESLRSSVDHDMWMQLAQGGYRALAVEDPVAICYQAPSKKSMMSHTRSRIEGVEQFLSKWRPVFEEWYGTERAKQFLEDYRIRVLGRLAGKKIKNGHLLEAGPLLKHLLTKQPMSLSAAFTLGSNVIYPVLSGLVPIWLKKRIRPSVNESEGTDV